MSPGQGADGHGGHTGTQPGTTVALLAAATERLRDVVERGAGVVADRTNGGQADNNDQREHHGVLDGGWAIFRNHEATDFGGQVSHRVSSAVVGRDPLVEQTRGTN